MDIKNSFNLTDILIGILAVLAIIFFIGVVFGLNEIWHNPILLKKYVLIALISIIILLINKKHNEKTIRQTNELIKQNEENLFIQLRYADAHRAINDLIKYILNLHLVFMNNLLIWKNQIFLKKKNTYLQGHF